MRVRIMSLWIAIVATILFLGGTEAEASSPSSWAEAQIYEAIEQGIVPDNLQQDYTKPITRGDFSALIMQTIETIQGRSAEELVEEEKRSIEDNPFKDTKETDIIAAYHLGIIKGISADTFAPQSPLLRKEAAVILTNAADALGRYTYNLSHPFKDRASIDEWALNSVDYVVHRNIMNGTADGSFDPNGTFTVEQAIITALRLFKDDGQLNISDEQREQIAKDGMIKRANTYAEGKLHPTQWWYRDSENNYKFTEDIKPIGTIIGYAVENVTTVYINGKYVRSYAVGDLDVINIRDLEAFGYEITEMKSDEFNQLYDQYTYSNNVILIKPMIDHQEDILSFQAEKVDKSNVLIGNAVYTLIGTGDQLIAYDPSITLGGNDRFSGIRMFTATTGDRFLAVQDLTNHWYQAPEWDWYEDEFKYGSSYGDWYQPDVEQEYFYYAGGAGGGNLALVDYSTDKELHVYTLAARERNLLRFSSQWWAIAQYPSLAEQLLDTREQEAFQYAQEVIAEIIQPDMSDRDKVDAIQNFFLNFDANFERSYYYSLSGGVNPSQRIDGALLERDANLTGWINTNKLLYSLAGLDVYPLYGTEAYETDRDEEYLLKIPVNIDGEWEFLYILH